MKLEHFEGSLKHLSLSLHFPYLVSISTFGFQGSKFQRFSFIPPKSGGPGGLITLNPKSFRFGWFLWGGM